MSERQPFKAVLEHDYSTLFGLGKQALFELAFATHARITDEDFEQAASGWLATARHPKFGRLFRECTYRPQVELLAYLRENGFKTYIVSADEKRQRARLGDGGHLRIHRDAARVRLRRWAGVHRGGAGERHKNITVERIYCD